MFEEGGDKFGRKGKVVVVIVNSIVSVRIYVGDVKRRGFLLLYV
jgi:hypothetical protein